MKNIELVYADPPWEQSRGGKKSVRPNSSGKPLIYPTLPLSEVEKILREYADARVLFLWTIDKYLFEAQEIAERLGYKLHARIIWDKVTGIPTSFDIRFSHEYLLWFYKIPFEPIVKEMRGKFRDVIQEQVRKHSQKPEQAYQLIEAIYPHLSKIELFARNRRIGWESWGNEIEQELLSIAQMEVE